MPKKFVASVVGGILVLALLALQAIEHWTLVDSVVGGLRDSGPFGKFLIDILLSPIVPLVLALVTVGFMYEVWREKHKEIAKSPPTESTHPLSVKDSFNSSFNPSNTNTTTVAVYPDRPKEPIPPPIKPNLTKSAPKRIGLSVRDGVWTANDFQENLHYRAWILTIRNTSIPGEDVGDAENIRAEVIISMGGREERSACPAAWENEPLSVVTIPHGTTKNLILAISERPHNGGYWTLLANNRHEIHNGISIDTPVIPYQPQGEIEIRLLDKSKILNTFRGRWKRMEFFEPSRSYPSGAFEIEI